MSFEIVPLREAEEPVFLSGLNASFENWGAIEQFRWVYRRDSGAGAADLFLARTDDGEVLGGTGVTFRRASNQRGVEAKLAIMTGSWVLPAARRKGCFTGLIQTMLGSAIESGSALLLGFCFKANKSYSRLLAAGFGSIDSAYLRDPQEYEPDSDTPPLESLDVGDRSSHLTGRPEGHSGFLYDTEQWREQFFHGPYPKAYLDLPRQSTALVEEAHGFLRVLALSLGRPDAFPDVLRSLLETARSRKQRLFLFTMLPDMTAEAKSAGLEEIPGAYIFKIACRTELAKWVDSAETVTEAELGDPRHESYLGPWWFQNRDRM